MPYTYQNYCFFHCPKTGGTSIARALSQHGRGYRRKNHQHDPPKMVRLNPKVVSITYIREPVAWYKSWYAFINSSPSDGPSRVWWYTHNKDLHDLARIGSFDKFITLLPVGRLWQVYDIYTEGVSIVVTMDKMPTHFELLTGIPLGHANRSKSDFEISHETFKMIHDKERMTYERWFDGH